MFEGLIVCTNEALTGLFKKLTVNDGENVGTPLTLFKAINEAYLKATDLAPRPIILMPMRLALKVFFL